MSSLGAPCRKGAQEPPAGWPAACTWDAGLGPRASPVKPFISLCAAHLAELFQLHGGLGDAVWSRTEGQFSQKHGPSTLEGKGA